MKICVLIPVYNEAGTIGNIVRNLRQLGMDVVVVNDGSTDGSGDMAGEAGAEVIENEKQQGKGYSLNAGIKHILAAHLVDGIIFMDGDGQHAIEDIDGFIQAAEKGSKFINGNRMPTSTRMPRLRRIVNQLMSWMISRVCGQRITDTQCGFRFVASEVLKNMDLRTRSFEIETEMLIKASKQGCRVDSVPIQTIYGDERSKIRPFRDTLRFFRYLLKEIFS